MPDLALLLIRAVSLEKQQGFCAEFFVSVKKHEQDISKNTPRISQFLAQYLHENPPSPIEKEKGNFLDGCVKQIYNDKMDGGKTDFDLDDSNRIRTCSWKVVSENSTAEEGDADIKLIDKAKKNGNITPLYKRILPKLAACYKQD